MDPGYHQWTGGVRTHDTAYRLGSPSISSVPPPTDNGLAHARLGSVPDRKTGATETVRKKATAIVYLGRGGAPIRSEIGIPE